MAENEQLIRQVQELEKQETPEGKKKQNKKHIFNILLFPIRKEKIMTKEHLANYFIVCMMK